jgi:hypothetical protein
MEKFAVYGFLGKLVARLICAAIAGVLAFLGSFYSGMCVDLRWAIIVGTGGAAAGFIFGEQVLWPFLFGW